MPQFLDPNEVDEVKRCKNTSGVGFSPSRPAVLTETCTYRALAEIVERSSDGLQNNSRVAMLALAKEVLGIAGIGALGWETTASSQAPLRKLLTYFQSLAIAC